MSNENENVSPIENNVELPNTIIDDNADMSQDDALAAIDLISKGVRNEPTPEVTKEKAEVEQPEETSEESTEVDEEMAEDEDGSVENEEDTEVEDQDSDNDDTDLNEESEAYDFSEIGEKELITINGNTKTRAQWDALAGHEKATTTKSRKVAEELNRYEKLNAELEKSLSVFQEAGVAKNELATLDAQLRELDTKMKTARAEGEFYELTGMQHDFNETLKLYKAEEMKVKNAEAQRNELAKKQDTLKTQQAIEGLKEIGLEYLTRSGKETKAWIGYVNSKLTPELAKVASLEPRIAEAFEKARKYDALDKKPISNKLKSVKKRIVKSSGKVQNSKQKADQAKAERFKSGNLSDADVEAEILRISNNSARAR